MYKTALVEADIEDGAQAVSALEASGLKVTAAFWSNSEDEDDWHLVVVSPDVAEKGSTQVYKQAFAPLHNLDTEPMRPINFWWDRIKIISPARLIYRMLKQRAGTGDGPVRPGWALDSYIYKLE
jgi:hypothetical protein